MRNDPTGKRSNLHTGCTHHEFWLFGNCRRWQQNNIKCWENVIYTTYHFTGEVAMGEARRYLRNRNAMLLRAQTPGTPKIHLGRIYGDTA